MFTRYGKDDDLAANHETASLYVSGNYKLIKWNGLEDTEHGAFGVDFIPRILIVKKYTFLI